MEKHLQPNRWKPDVGAARAYAATRHGEISFAVRSGGRLYGVGVRRTVPAASVLKAMLLVAYLREPAVRDRPLRQGDRGLLGPMVRWSDNAAATAVRNRVGKDALVRLAGRSGIARVRPPGWALYFKGGWGSGSGAVHPRWRCCAGGAGGSAWRSSPRAVRATPTGSGRSRESCGVR